MHMPKHNKYSYLVEPKKEIDFHGLGAGAAPHMIIDLILREITNAKEHHLGVIKLIVGKGNHSQNGAVIKPLAEKYLEQLKKQKIIKSFKYDSAFGTGPNEGAINVML